MIANAAHLTLDWEGNVRFGPDLQWLTPPATDPLESEGDAPDFWAHALAPEGTDAWLDAMHTAVQTYLPHVERAGLAPAYSGIRPKLVGPDHRGFSDFAVLWHASHALGAQHVWQTSLPDTPDAGAMVSLLGIESPGLTSSLALAEHVVETLAARVWGQHNPRGRASRYVEHVGHDDLAGWA